MPHKSREPTAINSFFWMCTGKQRCHGKFTRATTTVRLHSPSIPTPNSLVNACGHCTGRFDQGRLVLPGLTPSPSAKCGCLGPVNCPVDSCACLLCLWFRVAYVIASLWHFPNKPTRSIPDTSLSRPGVEVHISGLLRRSFFSQNENFSNCRRTT